jgi:hypothetical protein
VNDMEEWAMMQKAVEDLDSKIKGIVSQIF